MLSLFRLIDENRGKSLPPDRGYVLYPGKDLLPVIADTQSIFQKGGKNRENGAQRKRGAEKTELNFRMKSDFGSFSGLCDTHRNVPTPCRRQTHPVGQDGLDAQQWRYRFMFSSGNSFTASPGHLFSRKKEILLVEDNPGDVRIILEGFKDERIECNISLACDGQAAIDYMRGGYAEQGNGFPDIVLLDLNLPRKSGLEFLQEIKADPSLKVVPVIVLTTSTSGGDVQACYEAGANAYVTKPEEFDELLRMLRCFQQFWLDFAYIPDQESNSGPPMVR